VVAQLAAFGLFSSKTLFSLKLKKNGGVVGKPKLKLTNKGTA
jgi:hypothetical protein